MRFLDPTLCIASLYGKTYLMNKLTHFDANGQAYMVNVGDKPNTHRIAIATGKITMLPKTF